ncbi:hypothetical protein EV191_101788 [Tamaricihabitans halophyticus]|uniref:Secreted protein n=1 Tax=Tamaricihabitans halophyticus TaxID=1262583 RepID=A0A4R2RAV5_9PSEU|nr:hypothetical protein [Tamaricihabitans halophyticus]TCP56841.1 hypothetical protein EV191_101788 [Tamaricihabitans halophyticus]
MRRKIVFRALASGLLATGLVLATAQTVPAAPAAADTLTEIDKSPFQLAEKDSFAEYQPRVENLDKLLPKASFGDVLADANRDGSDLCKDTGIDGAVGFCWNDGDDATSEWYPQGISGSWDADPSGEYEGQRAMFTSWYHKGDKGARVSLVDYNDPQAPKYRHLLLVEPTAEDDFAQVKVHAGGIAWVGDYLYVVDTGWGVRVFDLNHLWQTEADPDKNQIGKGSDGKYYAYDYRYVLPQVGSFTQDEKGSCNPPPSNQDAPLCFSWVGLDRSTSPASLLTGEFFYEQEPGGRMARWPLDPNTGKLQGENGVTKPENVYASPHISMQGGVSADGTFLMSSSRGQNERGYLYKAQVDQESSSSRVPEGIEDLSYDPADGHVWSLTEYPNNRAVIGIPNAM